MRLGPPNGWKTCQPISTSDPCASPEIAKAARAYEGPSAIVVARGVHNDDPIGGAIKILTPILSLLYPRKATKRYLRPLKNLQKTLGTINDAAAALRLADELALERVELTIAVAVLARTDASRDARQRLAKEWAAYRGQEHFWR